MVKGGVVYILTNKNKTTLYVGVTSNLRKRLFEHKNHLYENSFTARYNLEYLIYYETFSTIEEAISREKVIKKWSRIKKENLIQTINPTWQEIVDFDS